MIAQDGSVLLFVHVGVAFWYDLDGAPTWQAKALVPFSQQPFHRAPGASIDQCWLRGDELPQRISNCLYSSVAERQSCKLKVLGSIPSGGLFEVLILSSSAAL